MPDMKEELKQARFIIGIDPGVNTGLAIYDREDKKLTSVSTETILGAIDHVVMLDIYKDIDETECGIFVRFEDARLRTWFGNSGREKLQGAGSIKRDCSIWEEFLTVRKIPFEKVAPKRIKTKLDKIQFQKITGWTKPTNEHGRDAAMLCLGY